MSSQKNAYCANYYGAVNCHNRVTTFGERCKLCTVMNEGSSTLYSPFDTSCHSYRDSISSQDDDSHEELRGRTKERRGCGGEDKVRRDS